MTGRAKQPEAIASLKSAISGQSELGAIGGECESAADGSVCLKRSFSVPGWRYTPPPMGHFPSLFTGMVWRELTKTQFELRMPSELRDRLSTPFTSLVTWRRGVAATSNDLLKRIADSLLQAVIQLHAQGWRLGMTSLQALYLATDKSGGIHWFLPDLGFVWIGTDKQGCPWLHDEFLPRHLKQTGEMQLLEESPGAAQLASPKQIADYHPDVNHREGAQTAWKDVASPLAEKFIAKDLVLLSHVLMYAFTGSTDINAESRSSKIPTAIFATLSSAQSGAFKSVEELRRSLAKAFGVRLPAESVPSPGPTAKPSYVMRAFLFLFVVGIAFGGAWLSPLTFREWLMTFLSQPGGGGMDPIDKEKTSVVKAKDPVAPSVEIPLSSWLPEVEEALKSGDKEKLKTYRQTLTSELQRIWMSAREREHVPLESRLMLETLRRIDQVLPATP